MPKGADFDRRSHATRELAQTLPRALVPLEADEVDGAVVGEAADRRLEPELS